MNNSRHEYDEQQHIAMNSNNEENNTFFSIWVILRGWIVATILVLICVIAGVAFSARSLNDFPYPHPGLRSSSSRSAYPDDKDYGGGILTRSLVSSNVFPYQYPEPDYSGYNADPYLGLMSSSSGYNTDDLPYNVGLSSSSSGYCCPDVTGYGGIDDMPTSSPISHTYTPSATVLNNLDPTLFTSNNDDSSINQENIDDDHEIKYIAVIGWYAIMIGLVFCIIPTVMALYQRRIRQSEINTREEIQSNINMIQNRMIDIEAQQQQHQRHNNSYDVQDDDNVTMFLTATENQDCTWDYLEGLFATATTTPTPTTVAAPRNSANNDAAFIGNNGSHGLLGRRRHVMNDILLGSVTAIDFIRGHVEKEELVKRRDCRRRLLAALKLYSMKITECHLISISDKEEEEGYIKSSSTAPMNGNTCDDSKNGGESNIADIADGCDTVNDEIVVNKMESSETDEINVSGDAKINMNNNDNTKSNLGAEEDGVSNSQQLNEEIGACSQLADVVSKSPQLMSLPLTKSRKDSDHVVVNDVNATNVEDDDDNKYSALLIPCTSTTSSSSENLLTRTVIPTCAICLVQYKPGNYVTWSSNDECCHAFHRDCILIWLFKKDASNGRSRRNNAGNNDGEDGEFGGGKYLCPCCRGEFVSSTLLKEISDAETTASLTPTTAM
jgi:hypothetical protein